MRSKMRWIGFAMILFGPIGLVRAQDVSLIRVACVGDSITAGARVNSDKESYPARLQSILGKRYQVRNFGVGGATLLKTGRPNIWKQLDAVREFQPDFVVVALGTNDTVGGDRQNWEQIDRFDDDCRKLIASLATLPCSPQVIMCTPTAMVLETPGLSESRLADLAQRKPRLKQLCRQIEALVANEANPRVTLLDLNGVLEGHPEWLTPTDGVHPNADGYYQLAEEVAREIRPRQLSHPNIVLFLVDDMGWQDTSVPFHHEVTPSNRRYRTPNMERLAASGIKFTQAYACSICSPTRISLMTGLNAARHRVTNWTLRKNASNDRAHATLEFPEWNVNGLSPVAGIERTIHARALPDYLREAGYRTIHVGKAHFGAEGTPGADPTAIGFDVNIGGHAAGGPGSYLASQNFSAAWRNGDRIWDVPGLEAYHGQDVFLTEALTLEAIGQMDQAIAAGRPFFLYMAHYAVHVPFAEDQRFFSRYLDAGLDRTEAMYAALVEGMDKSLGDLLDNLEHRGIADETVILFVSDNGGLSAQGRGGAPHHHNLPLSSGKGSAHEGGVRVPMIVRYPGITAPSTTCRTPVIIEDVFATLLEVGGVRQPRQIGGTIDGRSFVRLLRGQPDPDQQPRPLYWHCPNNWGPSGPGIGPSSCIRQGDWKLIFYYDGRPMELFNLEDDLGEQNNLAEKNLEMRDRLLGQLRLHLQQVDAQFPVEKLTGRVVDMPAGSSN